MSKSTPPQSDRQGTVLDTLEDGVSAPLANLATLAGLTTGMVVELAATARREPQTPAEALAGQLASVEALCHTVEDGIAAAKAAVDRAVELVGGCDCTPGLTGEGATTTGRGHSHAA